MLRLLVPTLVKVTVCAELVVSITTEPKLKLVGESFALVPIPVSVTLCGLPAASSVMLRTAMRVPDPVGPNVTLIVQLAPATNELPQLWV
jgi:hypothetical protein